MDAVILAGGLSRRLGRPKEDVRLGGQSLLERTIDACATAHRIVVVGPSREDLAGRRVVQVREDPPLGGPVAALAAAITLVEEPTVLVLACDMPRVVEVVASLPEPSGEDDACLALDRGRVQPLAGWYHWAALARALAQRTVEHASMRSVLDDLTIRLVDVPPGCTDDVDTPEDLDVARRREEDDDRGPRT